MALNCFDRGCWEVSVTIGKCIYRAISLLFSGNHNQCEGCQTPLAYYDIEHRAYYTQLPDRYFCSYKCVNAHKHELIALYRRDMLAIILALNRLVCADIVRTITRMLPMELPAYNIYYNIYMQ